MSKHQKERVWSFLRYAPDHAGGAGRKKRTVETQDRGHKQKIRRVSSSDSDEHA